nr:MAG TPA: hypothetical protein [Caudoviricetes sp.]
MCHLQLMLYMTLRASKTHYPYQISKVMCHPK